MFLAGKKTISRSAPIILDKLLLKKKEKKELGKMNLETIVTLNNKYICLCHRPSLTIVCLCQTLI